MLKQLLLISAFAGVSSMAFADDDLRATALSGADVTAKEKTVADADADSVHWKFPCKVGLNFVQTGYNYAWVGAPHSTMTFSGYADLQANYKKGKSMWNNELFAEYGLLHSGEFNDEKTRKNLDNLKFTSHYGYRATQHWYYSALFDFKSQLSNSYDYFEGQDGRDSLVRNSGFLAPANMIASLGMDYVPNKYVSVYIAPLTGRFTFCRTRSLGAAYGLPADEWGLADRRKIEAGAYLRVINDFDIVKNIHFTSKFDVFSPYASARHDAHVFDHMVATWDGLLTMKVTKYINTSFRWQMLYDDAIPCVEYNKEGDVIRTRNAKVQWMDALSIGFVYSF
ncbi:MAG: DUF3078 domain-containing protein [Paludibacteraceae bacterium]|nr:DUF3078 domain-containing protein [Paludibacteraceae bacterium]